MTSVDAAALVVKSAGHRVEDMAHPACTVERTSSDQFPYASHVARFHRAWLVAAVTFLVLMTSAAFRSSVGVLVVPLEDEFGWSRSVTSIAVAVNLLLYGLTAPFAAALMGRFGVRNIAAGALIATEAGATVTDKNGAPLRFNNPKPQSQGVIAAGATLHPQIVSHLAYTV